MWDEQPPRSALSATADSVQRPGKRRGAERIFAADADQRYLHLVELCGNEQAVLAGTSDHQLVLHPNDVAMLVLGPPRSGKTTAVLSSLVLSAPGPVVCVTTKTDIYELTAAHRAQLGPVMHFSPVGAPPPPGAQAVGWSPVTASATFDGAITTARALAAAERRSKVGDGHDEHFNDLATQVLVAAFYTAAQLGMTVLDARRWLPERDFSWSWALVHAVRQLSLLIDELDPTASATAAQIDDAVRAAATELHPLASSGTQPSEDELSARVRHASARALARSPHHAGSADGRTRLRDQRNGARSLAEIVALIDATASKEKSAIYTTAFRALKAYQRQGACDAAELSPAFDADAFVRQGAGPDDLWPALYITASDRDQAETVGFICGLIEQIRVAAQQVAAEEHYRKDRAFLHLVLDECANIAPLPFLPELISQAGGNRIFLACAFQDLSQARNRWGEEAQGFLSLFQGKILLRGLADKESLETLSLLAGEQIETLATSSTQLVERPVTPLPLHHAGRGLHRLRSETSTGENEHWRPVLHAADVHQLPPGVAAYYLGPDFDAVDLTAVGGWLTDHGYVPDHGRTSFWGQILDATSGHPW